VVAAWEDGVYNANRPIAASTVTVVSPFTRSRAGTLSCVRTKDYCVSDDRSVHTVPVTVLEWNADGTRLVSGDSVSTACG